MELDDIKSCWKAEDKRIAEHVKVNRKASFRKLRSVFDKIRVRGLFHLLSGCIYVPLILALIVFPNLKNDGSISFYLGLSAFILPIVAALLIDIYRYIRLLKVDFASSVLEAQKDILWLEKFDRIRNLSGLIVAPFAFWGLLRIFGYLDNKLLPEGILILVIVAVMLLVGILLRMKTIPREYNKIKSLLDEIEHDERE